MSKLFLLSVVGVAALLCATLYFTTSTNSMRAGGYWVWRPYKAETKGHRYAWPGQGGEYIRGGEYGARGGEYGAREAYEPAEVPEYAGAYEQQEVEHPAQRFFNGWGKYQQAPQAAGQPAYNPFAYGGEPAEAGDFQGLFQLGWGQTVTAEEQQLLSSPLLYQEYEPEEMFMYGGLNSPYACTGNCHQTGNACLMQAQYHGHFAVYNPTVLAERKTKGFDCIRAYNTCTAACNKK
jgi:hypothetical protein